MRPLLPSPTQAKERDLAQRAAELSEREAKLVQREAALAKDELAVAQRERELDRREKLLQQRERLVALARPDAAPRSDGEQGSSKAWGRGKSERCGGLERDER